jgi:hypothetical protein
VEVGVDEASGESVLVVCSECNAVVLNRIADQLTESAKTQAQDAAARTQEVIKELRDLAAEINDGTTPQRTNAIANRVAQLAKENPGLNDDLDKLGSGKAATRLLFDKRVPVGVRYGKTESVRWQGQDVDRATGVSARLTSAYLDANPGSPATIDPPGFRGGGGPDTPGHARGHLLANILGGAGDDPRNLVTIFQNRTNRRMLDYELQVRKAVMRGETVDYRVTPNYSGPNSAIPESITLEARGSDGFTLDITIRNTRS